MSAPEKVIFPKDTIVCFTVASHPGMSFVGKITGAKENQDPANNTYTVSCKITQGISPVTIVHKNVKICSDKTDADLSGYPAITPVPPKVIDIITFSEGCYMNFTMKFVKYVGLIEKIDHKNTKFIVKYSDKKLNVPFTAFVTRNSDSLHFNLNFSEVTCTVEGVETPGPTESIFLVVPAAGKNKYSLYTKESDDMWRVKYEKYKSKYLALKYKNNL